MIKYLTPLHQKIFSHNSINQMASLMLWEAKKIYNLFLKYTFDLTTRKSLARICGISCLAMPILPHSTLPRKASQQSNLTVCSVKLLEQTPVWFWPMKTSTFPNNSWARLVVRASYRPFNKSSLHELPCLGLKV